VAAGWKHLGNAGCGQAFLGHAEGCAQSGAAGTDDYDIIGMVDEFVS
jgi:hypothetical protein